MHLVFTHMPSINLEGNICFLDLGVDRPRLVTTLKDRIYCKIFMICCKFKNVLTHKLEVSFLVTLSTGLSTLAMFRTASVTLTSDMLAC